MALISDVTRNANRCTTISDTGAEGTNVTSFMTTSEAEIVVFSINSDVLCVLEAELFDGSFDGLDASRLPHFLGTEVGVAASAIPVSLKGFGVEGDFDTPLFSNADEKIASHPEVVSHGDAFTGTNLELPLGRHNFSVDTADVDAGVEAGAVVSLD